MATYGNNSNTGTLAAPFLTFEKARDYMRTSTASAKTIYIRAGTYSRTAVLPLTSADNSETWAVYPGDPVNSVIIEGNNITDVIDILGGSNITINGFTIQNYSSRAIGVHGGAGHPDAGPYFNTAYGSSNGNTISNNIILHGKLPGWDRAGIDVEGTVTNTTISHNVIQDSWGYGIGVWSLVSGDNISGTSITGNILLNVMQSVEDGGAIYIIDRTSVSTDIQITNNFIRDYGVFGNSAVGIYMDDQLSNATVTGNIVAGAGSVPIMYHGGENNTVKSNIFDLGSTGNLPVVLYGNSVGGKTMGSNRFIGNIILSSYTTDTARFAPSWGGPYYGVYLDITAPNAYVTPLQVQNNFYHNYSTGGEKAGGGYNGPNYRVFDDSNPVLGDPQISGWNYNIAPGSSVYNGPVSFPAIDGDWGPPGYMIPHTGTQPSCSY